MKTKHLLEIECFEGGFNPLLVERVWRRNGKRNWHYGAGRFCRIHKTWFHKKLGIKNTGKKWFSKDMSWWHGAEVCFSIAGDVYTIECKTNKIAELVEKELLTDLDSKLGFLFKEAD